MPRWRKFAIYLAAVFSFSASVCIHTSAQAATLTLTCSLTPSAQAKMVQEGLSSSATTVMHVNIDTSALTVTDWATYPGATYPPNPVTYAAKVTSDLISWATPPDDEGDTATRYLNRVTNVLTTVDPGGTATEWNCAL